jgi:dTMP kinase
MFITFEGGEGSGKSVQAKLLHDFLLERGYDVLLTREPGGTPLAEDVRRIVLTGEPEKMSALTETLLYLAARADHWNSVIKPALDANKIVICDRFHDSTLVYQGMCKGVSENFLNAALIEISDGQKPDRTYLLDIDPQIGIARAFSRKNDETRFENMDMSFHEQVRAGFLKLVAAEPERFLTLDGSRPIESGQEEIRSDMMAMLARGR